MTIVPKLRSTVLRIDLFLQLGVFAPLLSSQEVCGAAMARSRSLLPVTYLEISTPLTAGGASVNGFYLGSLHVVLRLGHDQAKDAL